MLEKLKKQNKAIIANECGTGKSKSAIDGMLYHLNDTQQSILVLAPTFEIATNWKSEIRKHSDGVGIFIGAYRKDNEVKVADTRIRETQGKQLDNIIRYEPFKYRFILMTVHTLKIPSMTKVISGLISDGHIGGIICDEAHKLVSLNTEVTRSYLKLPHPKYEYMLTATPVRNYFDDMELYFKRLDIPVPNFLKDSKLFKQTFTIVGKTGRPCGNKNQVMLRNLVGNYLIQYGKEYIQDKLPKLREQNHHLCNSEYINAQIQESVAHYTQTCALAVMNKCEKSAFKYKAVAANKLIMNLVIHGKRVIVFSRFTEQLELINLGAKLNGNIDGAKIHREVEEFKKGNTRVICSTYGCLGAGIELCPATEIIILDEPWTQADIEQAVSRIHRLSNPNPVCNIHYIRLPKSVDGHIHKIVHNKGVTGTFNENKKFFGDDELLNEKRIKF